MSIIFKDRDKNSILGKNDNNIYLFLTNKPEETIVLGMKIGNMLQKGDLIAINGNLGSGKTCLIKGIVLGLKSDDCVTSPSFSIIKEYTANIPIFHFDFYRFDKAEEIEELGYEEYFFGEGVTLIEWASKIETYLPEEFLLINIFFANNHRFSRKIIFQPKGERYKKMVKDLKSVEYIGN